MTWAANIRRYAVASVATCCLLYAPLLSAQHTVAEQYLFQSINVERAIVGLAPLTWNEPLTGAALYHAERMRAAGNISHQYPGEPDVAARAAAEGARFSRVAENVAMSPSILQMHTALMNSPHHRENILDPQVNSIGISVVASRGELFAVEDFARDVQPLSFDQQEELVGSLLVATGVRDVVASAEARSTCRLSTGFVGTRPAFVMRYTASDLSRLPSQLTARLSQGGVTQAAVGACSTVEKSNFTSYSIAIVLYR